MCVLNIASERETEVRNGSLSLSLAVIGILKRALLWAVGQIFKHFVRQKEKFNFPLTLASHSSSSSSAF
jgi:hypothetical protein